MADPLTTPAVQVPPIVQSLYGALRAITPAEGEEDGVRVTVGPDTAKKFAARVVTLAASWDERLDPVSVERTERGRRPLVLETTTITCSASVGGSGHDFATWRAQAGELLAVVDQAARALAADDTQTARGYTRWIDWADEDGANSAVIVDFVLTFTTIS